MRFNQQDFRRRFGMNVFTVAAARATIGWLWLLIQLADLLLHRSRSAIEDRSTRPFIAQAGSPIALPPVNSKSRRSAAPA